MARNLTRARPWTPEEETTLGRLYLSGMMYNRIALEMDRPKSSVASHVYLMVERGALRLRRSALETRAPARVEIHIRISRSAADRLRTQASARGMKVNRYLSLVVEDYIVRP